MSDFYAPADGDAPLNPTTPRPVAAWLSRRHGPFRNWEIAVWSLLLVLGLTAVIVWRAQSPATVNYYAITPGQAQSVAPFIEVPPSFSQKAEGKILLTDVYLVGPLNTSNLKTYRNNPDDEVISSTDLLGPSTPESQYLTQGYLDMTQAQSDATSAALTHLGYTVQGQNAGVMVYGITPGTEAANEISVGQIVTKVNGRPTPTDCSLLVALHGMRPRAKATLSVENSSVDNVGNFVSGPVSDKTVTLQRPPANEPTVTGCGPAFKPTAIIGFQPDPSQWVNWKFPVKVTVHTTNIGGPSAGLAMTLGIIDKLSDGRLIGNHTVAATGTIDAKGNVGDVGGVPQKTLAVERAGATVFFVPVQELAAAKSKATPKLHVYAVSTLDQALAILERMGGKVPPKHVPVEAAP
ncbi:MAG TPA: S16 family serine protease [Acidimicrobiales bacterium]|jgi:PDZ domain-containing protein